MSHNKVNVFNVDAHIAEIYDQQQNFAEDVQRLLALIANRGPLRIFKPFCGTGEVAGWLQGCGFSIMIWL